MTQPHPVQTATMADSMSAITAAMQRDAALYALALREDGLLPETPVATGSGWRAAQSLVPGDMVLTFDAGMQPVTRVHELVVPRSALPEHKAFTMVIPAGVLGNREPMSLLPLQEIIVESDFAEQRYGDPFVLIQALMLDGFGGIHRQPITDDLRIVMPTFEHEQLIHTSGMALVTARAESDFSPLEASMRLPGPEYTRAPREDLGELIASLTAARTA